MLADKTLLLKGLAGVAAVGGVVGGSFAAQKAGLFSPSSNAGAAQSQTQNQENAEQARKNAEEIAKQKEEKKSKVNEQLTKLGLTDCLLVDGDLTSPTEFSKECDLDQAKLQNIKFSNKAEDGNVTVSGLSGNIKLKIANKGDDKVSYKFSGHGSKITISGDTDKPHITLKPSVEREFEEKEEGKLSKVPASGATDASTLNTKIKALGLSNKCWFEEGENETSVECSLNKEELQKISFSNKAENSEVTVEGLTGNINLKIEKKGADKLGYKFSGASSKITITGDTEKGKITLPKTEEREFEEKEEGKLSKVSASSNASTLNEKLKNLGIPNKCRFEEGENEGSIECNLNKTELQKIPFSNKGNSDVTVEGLNEGNIKLKIEKKDNNSKLGFTFSDITSKLTIKGDQTKPNITLKPNETREFEEKTGGKLGKVVKNASAASKLKEANKKLETIKLPDKCRFEEEDDEISLQCDVSKEEDLKNIEFYNKPSSDKQLTISGSTNNLKLTINRFEDDEEGPRKYKTNIDLEFIFSGYSEEIKIQESSSIDIVLKPKITNLFTIENNKLSKYFDASAMAGKLNLSCSGSSPNFTCTPWETSKKIKVLNTNKTDIDEITVGSGDTETTIMSAANDVDNYELGIKFSVTKAYPTNSPKLENSACYEPKYIKGKDKGWVLSKKDNC